MSQPPRPSSARSPSRSSFRARLNHPAAERPGRHPRRAADRTPVAGRRRVRSGAGLIGRGLAGHLLYGVVLDRSLAVLRAVLRR